jgi:hypothetical protein
MKNIIAAISLEWKLVIAGLIASWVLTPERFFRVCVVVLLALILCELRKTNSKAVQQ